MTPFEVHHALAPLFSKESLTSQEAEALMALLLADSTGDATRGAALGLLRKRGVKAGELAAFAYYLRSHANVVSLGEDDIVDTCGTGGGVSSFNLSTAAALVAAAAGAKVGKHGNRAVTSKCGSADVLEFLGVKLISDPAKLRTVLSEVGVVFLFAPAHHPAMKAVGPARKDLGFKTVFNQLGPLANPFGARRQLLGVYDSGLVETTADALLELGAIRAYVVHSDDGLDEISPCAPTTVAIVEGGSVRMTKLRPEDFGLELLHERALAPGATIQEGAEILLDSISNVGSERAKAILPNVAATLVIAGIANSLREGVDLASQAISSGKARQTLERLVEESQK